MSPITIRSNSHNYKMNDDEKSEMLAKCMKASEESVGNIVYSVVFDVCNEIINEGANSEKVLECANRVVNRYLEGGIKVRKKPAARAPKATTRSVDAAAAASRKMLSGIGQNVLWLVHPESSEYSYTLNLKLKNGHPVRNNMTKKICYVVNEHETRMLSDEDVKVARSLGMTPADDYV